MPKDKVMVIVMNISANIAVANKQLKIRTAWEP